MQNALPGLLTPGQGWAARVFEAGLRGLYQHMRNLGLEPGEEMLAAMQAGSEDTLGAAGRLRLRAGGRMLERNDFILVSPRSLCVTSRLRPHRPHDPLCARDDH